MLPGREHFVEHAEAALQATARGDIERREYLRESSTHTVCPWKGTASYYDVVANDETNKDAAWYYPSPKDAAKEIANYVAFWHGVRVEA